MNQAIRRAAAAVFALSLVACKSEPAAPPFPPGFEPLHPPQSGWKVGNLVLKKGARVDFWGAVEEDFGVGRDAPDRSYSSTEMGSLSADAVFPEAIRVELAAEGARDFTAELRGCRVIDLNVFAFSKVFDRELADVIRDKLESRLEDGEVYYVVSGLTASELEYTFKTEQGAKLDLDPGALAEAISETGLGAEYEVTKEGTLTYLGDEPLWVAFKLRPIDDGGSLQSSSGSLLEIGRTLREMPN